MKLTMMRGIPGSGKTTRARELVVESGNSARVNRDDLRAMLFDGKWSGKREAAVIAVEKAIAAALLRHGLNPIIDDTNLLPKHEQMWKQFAVDQGQGKTLSFQIEGIDTPREECLRRDVIRNRKVGAPVINRMAAQSGKIDWGERPIAIFDIDGTLADGRHREHLVNGTGKRDWEAYFELCGEDEPIEIVVKILRALRDTHTIVIVSGRPDTYYEQTKLWLDVHVGVNTESLWRLEDPTYIFMRSGGDSRSDVDVKNDIVKLLPKDKIDVVFDDRPSVIEGVWRANGIRVIPVRGACEAF